MAKNLYVGNLAFGATEDEVRTLFEQYGSVDKVQLVTDRETGRARGFGFVEMADGGDKAISELNGQPFGGRPLTVNEAKPRENRGGGRGGFGGGRDRY